MPTFNFGSGAIYGYRTDVVTPTPLRFGVLQEIQVDFSFTNKELMGQGQFAVAVGRGAGKITGKAKLGQISPLLMANLFFGAPLGAGKTSIADLEAAAVPAANPYTVPVANAATWSTDLGVSYAATGVALTRVVSAPAAGEYAVAAGIYTFAAADVGAAVLISYAYGVAASGGTIVIGNPAQGSQPVFAVSLRHAFNGPAGMRGGALTLYACTSEKLSLPMKQSDFTMQDFEFMAFANSANQVGAWSFDEVS